MKILLLFIMTLSTAFAADSTVACKQAIQDVLSKPVSADGTFVSDEKRALSFINAFDLQKMGFYQDLKTRKHDLDSCEMREYCFQGLEAHGFLKSLQKAKKQNAWSKETKSKADKIIHSYLIAVRNNPSTLLNLALAVDLINHSDPTKESKKLAQDIQKATEDLSSSYAKMKTPVSCEDAKRAVKREVEKVLDLNMKFKEIVKN